VKPPEKRLHKPPENACASRRKWKRKELKMEAQGVSTGSASIFNRKRKHF